jgi:hypothetical protein
MCKMTFFQGSQDKEFSDLDKRIKISGVSSLARTNDMAMSNYSPEIRRKRKTRVSPRSTHFATVLQSVWQ